MTTRGVYAIICVDGRAYVGASENIGGRWASHRYALRNGRSTNSPLQEAWDALGEQAFSFSVLESVPPGQSLEEAEQRWMDTLRVVETGFNVSPTAGSNKGAVFMPQARKNIRAALVGRILSPEHRQKISEKSRTLRHSDATKQKISALKVGVFRGENGPAAKLTEDDVKQIKNLARAGVFQREIAARFGVSRPAISKIITGRTWLCARNGE